MSSRMLSYKCSSAEVAKDSCHEGMLILQLSRLLDCSWSDRVGEGDSFEGAGAKWDGGTGRWDGGTGPKWDEAAGAKWDGGTG